MLGEVWESVGMSSVWLGLALHVYQSEVDHLSNFQSEVDHGLKIEVDQEFKKIQVDQGSKIKTQVDLGFKKYAIKCVIGYCKAQCVVL
jgi:hypothetical protein